MNGEAEKAKIDIHKELSNHPKMNGNIRLNFFKGKYANYNVTYSGLPVANTKETEKS